MYKTQRKKMEQEFAHGLVVFLVIKHSKWSLTSRKDRGSLIASNDFPFSSIMSFFSWLKSQTVAEKTFCAFFDCKSIEGTINATWIDSCSSVYLIFSFPLPRPCFFSPPPLFLTTHTSRISLLRAQTPSMSYVYGYNVLSLPNSDTLDNRYIE